MSGLPVPNRSSSSACARSDSDPGASNLASDSPEAAPRRQHAGADQQDQGQREHEPAAADEQEAQPAQRRARRVLAGGAGAGGHHEISPKVGKLLVFYFRTQKYK
ncbi:hypothetical protein GCM10020220_044450 [Nonomuraea rubra]|uniref:hypothetical protein n=1 Tax=Nonomuraea rubra TaxID=46180 RepID=UPI0031E61FDD